MTALISDLLVVFSFFVFAGFLIISDLSKLDKKIILFASVPFVVFSQSFAEAFLRERYIAFGSMPDFTYLRMFIGYMFLAFSIGLFIANILSKKIDFKIKYDQIFDDYQFCRRIEKLLIILFAIGFSYNLFNVITDIELIVLNPRLYEEKFGATRLTNYLYFLAPVICCFIIYRWKAFEKKFTSDKYILILLILSSFFHGIKFTIFDTIFIPLFFYLTLNRKKKFPVFASLAFIIFIELFGQFVRGGESILVNYVAPNFLNAAHIMEGILYPFKGLSLIFPEQAVGSFVDGSNLNPGGFIFNDKYNMSTGLPILVGFLYPLGPIFIALVFYYILLTINKGNNSLFNSFLHSLLLVQVWMFFFYSSSVKDKYWFYIFLLMAMVISGYLKHLFPKKS